LPTRSSYCWWQPGLWQKFGKKQKSLIRPIVGQVEILLLWSKTCIIHLSHLFSSNLTQWVTKFHLGCVRVVTEFDLGKLWKTRMISAICRWPNLRESFMGHQNWLWPSEIKFGQLWMIKITFDHPQMAKIILGHPHEITSDYLLNGKIRFTLNDQQYLWIHYLSIQAQMPSP